jgi:hypothetical protein
MLNDVKHLLASKQGRKIDPSFPACRQAQDDKRPF